MGDVDVAHDIANNITAQCAADPLIQSGTTLVLNEDQCADDGGTNEDGGLF
ncbi:MAG: hypothetical protein M3N18_11275 [Actinomycetota bacterium]|nr:hypothetical protein [Actinomycetota bacterium]